MVNTALRHLRHSDPILAKIIVEVPEVVLRNSGDFFAELCDAIVSQQLSVKAGETILNRIKDLFPDRKLTPDFLLTIPDETLRQCGSSWSKIRYMKDLATKVVGQELLLEKLIELEDEAVIVELTKVKGIGRWTAEMFLMFSLGRENVFSFGDAGLLRAIRVQYDLDIKTDQAQIERLVETWSPYKTYAARVLWKSLNNT